MNKLKCVCCGEFVSDSESRAKAYGMKYAVTDCLLETESGVCYVFCNECNDPFPNLRKEIVRLQIKEKTEKV